MITLKIIIKEEKSKEFEDLIATGISIEKIEERRKPTDNEIKVCNRYKVMLNKEEKVTFINESKKNSELVDELIKEIKQNLGI